MVQHSALLSLVPRPFLFFPSVLLERKKRKKDGLGTRLSTALLLFSEKPDEFVFSSCPDCMYLYKIIPYNFIHAITCTICIHKYAIICIHVHVHVCAICTCTCMCYMYMYMYGQVAPATVHQVGLSHQLVHYRVSVHIYTRTCTVFSSEFQCLSRKTWELVYIFLASTYSHMYAHTYNIPVYMYLNTRCMIYMHVYIVSMCFLAWIYLEIL